MKTDLQGKPKWVHFGAGKMKQGLCIFNLTREPYAGLNVAAADNTFSPLKDLLSRINFAAEDGIWPEPSLGIHAFSRLFPVDLLDDANRVIHLVEHPDSFRLSAIRQGFTSVLELPKRTLYSSHTKADDVLLIGSPEEMHTRLGAKPVKLPRDLSKEELIAKEIPGSENRFDIRQQAGNQR
jgi:hypothetical protein